MRPFGHGMLAGFLFVPPVAHLLDHEPPSLPGFLVALTAVPAVLVADACHKSRARGRRNA